MDVLAIILVVLGGDSRSEGHEFESQHCYWMKNFPLICCKICNVCLKKTENKRKRGRGWAIQNSPLIDDEGTPKQSCD